MSLIVENLKFSYKNNLILNNISFKLQSGSLVSLLGSNGAGKSTLFKCILQLNGAYDGNIYVNKKNIRDLTISQRAKHIAYIPQSNQGIFNYTVEEVVLMGATIGSIFAKPKNEDVKNARDALEKVNISHLVNRGFMELSGGERQLVLIARALSQKASIFIMDEPTSSLDFGNQIYVMEIAKSLAKEGYLIFLSTHNPDFALSYSDRVIILNNGEIISDGNPIQAMTSDVLSKIYNRNVRVEKIENSDKRVCISDSWDKL